MFVARDVPQFSNSTIEEMKKIQAQSFYDTKKELISIESEIEYFTLLLNNISNNIYIDQDCKDELTSNILIKLSNLNDLQFQLEEKINNLRF